MAKFSHMYNVLDDYNMTATLDNDITTNSKIAWALVDVQEYIQSVDFTAPEFGMGTFKNCINPYMK